MTADAPSDTAWTEIYPPFNVTTGVTLQFFGWMLGTTLIVYWLGSLNREGGALAAAYLLVFPGALGLGWFVLWLLYASFVVHRRERRIERAAREAFADHASRFGRVHHLDMSLNGGTVTGLALAGTSLLVVQDGQLRKLRHAEIRGWRWEIQGAAQFIGRGEPFERLEVASRDLQARERVNGVYLQTFDPSRPEIHFKTHSEETCRRWEVILENIDSGRTVID